ncbi:hypothetical protein [Pedobacter lusitanus]|uniref:hypothetical protein n=1 Tax=Pedobacter lusitanus TaxID=1503925 RepID=UPI00069777E7|nr:hypothetical protein [Pedobacter lusitanus]
MKQFIPLTCAAILLISCNGQQKNNQKVTGLKDTQAQDSIQKPIPATAKTTQENLPEISKAKSWLTAAIENSLNKANGNMENTNEEAEENIKSIYTKQYDEYKDDAINVDLDNGLTSEEFFTKWKDKYNPKLAGIGTGLFIPEQDYGLIKVTHCELKNKIGDNFIFSVVIEDTESKIKHNRDIRLIPSGSTFLIDDIMEY